MDDPATSACRQGFLAWTFIASIHPSNPCSTISRELIPQQRGGLAIDMLALSISAMSHKRMVPRPPTMARSRVRTKWFLNCSNWEAEELPETYPSAL